MKKQENDAFVVFDNTKIGLLFDDTEHENYPIRYYNVINNEGLQTKNECSYYGFVYEGAFDIVRENKTTNRVSEGMYFSIPGAFDLKKVTLLEGDKPSQAIVIEVEHTKGIYPINNYSAVYTIGGEIESKGRLKYIDGCSDSLLIAPVKLGDPCFNHLHFPDSINQTQHTHPSHRIGIVADGYGECITPFGNLPLEKNMIFIIKEWDGNSFGTGLDGKTYPVGQHAFRTFDSVMNVIAFHPDSDFGATDINHPMINRTIIDGISANELEDIRTNIIK
jgi:hypothetical protein